MFDVGLSEVMLLLAIGLVVLGPERLPRVARTLGAYVRKARTAWYQVKYDIDRELQASEMRQTWQDTVGQAQRDLKEVNQEVRTELGEAQQALDQINQASQQANTQVHQELNALKQTALGQQTSQNTPGANDTALSNQTKHQIKPDTQP